MTGVDHIAPEETSDDPFRVNLDVRCRSRL